MFVFYSFIINTSYYTSFVFIHGTYSHMEPRVQGHQQFNSLEAAEEEEKRSTFIEGPLKRSTFIS